MEQVVLREEISYRRAPILNANGLNMLGPVLMLYGTEEQKRQHLPGIAGCDVMWAQGYSEPNAGSDLASLQTRAVRDGDDYVLNGRRSGPATASTRTGSSCSPAPIPSRPSTRASASFSCR